MGDSYVFTNNDVYDLLNTNIPDVLIKDNILQTETNLYLNKIYSLNKQPLNIINLNETVIKAVIKNNVYTHPIKTKSQIIRNIDYIFVKNKYISYNSYDCFEDEEIYSNPAYIKPVYELGYFSTTSVEKYTPKSVGAYIINKNKQVLLVKNYKNLWSGVGGWIYQHEKPYIGLIREIVEENNNKNTKKKWIDKLWILGKRDIILDKKATRLYIIYYNDVDLFYNYSCNNTEIIDWGWVAIYDFMYDVYINMHNYREFVSRDIIFIDKILNRFLFLFNK